MSWVAFVAGNGNYTIELHLLKQEFEQNNVSLIKELLIKFTNKFFRNKIIIETKLNFEQLKNNIIHSNLNALYLIWKNPYMTVGKDTFIHDMLTQM